MNPGLYHAGSSNYPYFFYDIITGYDGYSAGPGYDFITGLGNVTGKDLANRFFGVP